MPICAIHDIHGKKIDELKLPEAIFDGKVNAMALHQAVVMYQTNQRQGNASSKGRAEVSGGGKKPWRQKGTGRARAGSSRSPLWKGGGVTFGPEPRDFTYQIPRKVKSVALKASLNSKINDNDLLCVDELAIDSSKTKDFMKLLKGLKLEGKILAVVDSVEENLSRVSRNLSSFCMMRSADVTGYDILRYKKLLITKAAFKNLLKRIQ
jgi:large subunit ribosomal protein L4